MSMIAARRVTSLVDERRRSQRISLDVPVTVSFNVDGARWTETDAALIDLSRQGMRVRCDRQPGDGHRILVGILHPTHGLCAASGRLVRLDGSGSFGVRFERANDGLARFVAALAADDTSPVTSVYASGIDARVWIEAARR